MIEVRFRDIDPDTGKVSHDKLLSISETIETAQLIEFALTKACDDEPNREFYIRDLSNLERELTYEERVAWFVANYYETGMEYEGMLDSLRDADLDQFKWYDETICFPRTFSELKQQIA